MFQNEDKSSSWCDGMFEIEGKYNTVKVFTDNVTNGTVSQIMNLLNQESCAGSQIRVMPDTHEGAGCVIGMTMTIQDKVIPNLVGADIGCGMCVVRLGKEQPDFQKVDDVMLRGFVPSGASIHDVPKAEFKAMSKIKAEFNMAHAELTLGTLGGGNHFIEIDKDDEGNYYLVVHSGSRHLGKQVAEFYQKKAVDALNAFTEGIEKHSFVPLELAFVSGQDFADYIHDMSIVQEYARCNREEIARTIIRYGMPYLDYSKLERFHTVHNYIDTDSMILRKGAVSAQEGELLLIPMNMRDGSLLCIGKGNPDWNFSAPHGAGRTMSRSQAKANVSVDEYKESMKGVYTTSVCKSTIDESPMAYKPMDEIIQNIEPTVEIVKVIKPVYNFKAH